MRGDDGLQIRYRQSVRKNRARTVGSMLIIVCILLLLLVLQTTLLPMLSVFFAVPNLPLVLCIYFSLIHGGPAALVFSVFAGLLQEALNGGAMGYNALLYLLLSWICVCLSDRWKGRSMLVTLPIVFLLTLVHACFYWGVMFLLWNQYDFGGFLLHHIFPSTLCNTVIAPIFIFLVNKLCSIEASRRDLV